MTQRFPQFLHDLLNSRPQAGEGVHNWLFRVARQLHAHLPAGEIIELLAGKVLNCGRHVPRSEIMAAVRDSVACAWRPTGNAAPSPTAAKWPAVNQARRKSILNNGVGLVDLWEESRVRIEDNAAHSEEIIDALFPGNCLLCCGRSQTDFHTRSREEWRGKLSQLALIVPSPMVARCGVTQGGKKSAHTLANTGPRRFLVIEFDQGTTDEHAALLLHLATYGPMVCALHSGGKSMHGWFYTHGQPEDKVEKFFRYAVSIGADHQLWTRSQFVRMPDGTRDNGKRQTVFFLSYKPLRSP